MRRFLLLLAVLLLTIGAVSAANPVVYYPFDGDATDSIGSLDGILNNNPSFAGGYYNQSLSCDGVDDSASVSLPLSTYSEFSISAWFKTTETDKQYIIGDQINKYSATSIQVDGGKVTWRQHWNIDSSSNSIYVYGASGLDDGEWHNLIATYEEITDGYTLTLYVDGELIGTKSKTGQTALFRSSQLIGAGEYNHVNYFADSEIDDVKIYNSVVSESEAIDIYQDSIHNSFVLSAYDELNQSKLTISSFNVYNANESITDGTIIDGDCYVYSNQFDSLGQYIASIDVNGYYSRNFIVENEYIPVFVSTYLPPESETIIYEQFTLNDNVALYEPSDIIIKLDKPMGSGTNTIYSSYFDLNSQATTYLIPTDAYILYIITPTQTINYGWLYPDADGQVTIILNPFEFEEQEDWLDYTYECTDLAVSFDYTSSKPIDTAAFVISYDNGTEAYNANATTDTGSFTYNFPGNATYKIDISVEADDDNTFTMQKFIEIGKTNQRDFFPEEFSLLLKSICVMFGVVVGVIGLSSYRSDLSAIWAFVLYAFAVYQDWIFGNAITVSILGIIALAAIKKFQKRESRM